MLPARKTCIDEGKTLQFQGLTHFQLNSIEKQRRRCNEETDTDEEDTSDSSNNREDKSKNGMKGAPREDQDVQGRNVKKKERKGK